MPKIDFYRTHEAAPKAILIFACKVLEEAYHQNHTVYVNTQDEAAAHQMNELLWTFHDISFIPHHLLGEQHAIIPPIEIGYESDYQPKHHDVLFNLDTNIPPFFAEFEKIIEIISEDEKQKENARNKYRQYSQQGYEINIHN